VRIVSDVESIVIVLQGSFPTVIDVILEITVLVVGHSSSPLAVFVVVVVTAKSVANHWLKL